MVRFIGKEKARWKGKGEHVRMSNWMEMARAGDAEAMVVLGDSYYTGWGGVGIHLGRTMVRRLCGLARLLQRDTATPCSAWATCMRRAMALP